MNDCGCCWSFCIKPNWTDSGTVELVSCASTIFSSRIFCSLKLAKVFGRLWRFYGCATDRRLFIGVEAEHKFDGPAVVGRRVFQARLKFEAEVFFDVRERLAVVVAIVSSGNGGFAVDENAHAGPQQRGQAEVSFNEVQV